MINAIVPSLSCFVENEIQIFAIVLLACYGKKPTGRNEQHRLKLLSLNLSSVVTVQS